MWLSSANRLMRQSEMEEVTYNIAIYTSQKGYSFMPVVVVYCVCRMVRLPIVTGSQLGTRKVEN